jgi:hypothetical protein
VNLEEVTKFDCHIQVDILVSRGSHTPLSLTEGSLTEGCDDNQWTCVRV